MISDKERRAVAARMREIMRDDPHGWLDIMVSKAVADVMGDGVVIGETLADLIDCPTCEMEFRSGEQYGRCSHCGAFVRRDAVTDCIGEISVKFCPNCRAEVLAVKFYPNCGAGVFASAV